MRLAGRRALTGQKKTSGVFLPKRHPTSFSLLALLVGVSTAAQQPPSAAARPVDLAAALAAGQIRAVNREVTRLADVQDGVHLSEQPDPGLAWISGTDFGEGTIEIDVRGRDVLQRSFVGIAFHGAGEAYECVYLRPFNFRADDPDRHRHAVQYMAPPDADWPRLRDAFPNKYEAPVDASVAPTAWVHLRVVVGSGTVRIYVGGNSLPALDVPTLGHSGRGLVGVWTGNNSDGDFSHLRITPAK